MAAGVVFRLRSGGGCNTNGTMRHARLTRAGATKNRDMEELEENQQQSGSGLESSACSAIREYVQSLNEVARCKKELISEYEKTGDSKESFDAQWEDGYWISNLENCETMLEATFKEAILRQRKLRIEKKMKAEIQAIQDEIENLY